MILIWRILADELGLTERGGAGIVFCRMGGSRDRGGNCGKAALKPMCWN